MAGREQLISGGDSIPWDKLFAEREGLRLIVRLESRPVDDLRRFRSALQAEFAEELSVLDEERHIVWTYLEHGFGTTMFIRVHSQSPDQKSPHNGCVTPLSQRHRLPVLQHMPEGCRPFLWM